MKESRLKSIIAIILSLVAVSFFLGIAINSIAYISLLAVGLVNVLMAPSTYNGKDVLWTSVVLFLYIFIRECFEGLNIEKSEILSFLPLLAIPLIFGGLKFNKNLVGVVLKSYVITAILTASINIAYAFYRGYLLPGKINYWYFSYDFLAEPFSLQPIYLGLFYVFALICLIPMIRGEKLYSIGFIFIFVSLVLLGARNALLSALIVIPIYCLIKFKFSLKWLTIFVVIVSIGGAIGLNNPILKNRFLKATTKGNFFSGTDLRSQIWGSSLSASKTAFVFGHGKDGGKEELFKEFEKRGLETPLKYEYHSHSQYLDFLLSYGVIGLLLFLAILIQLFIKFFANKDWIALFWLISVVLSCVTESVLFRQWGIIYFTFFGSLFYTFGIRQNFDLNKFRKISNEK